MLPPLLILLIVSAVTCTAQDYISTTGYAVVPDEAIVRFGFETFSPDLIKSKANNDDRATTVLKEIRKLGIQDCHIQTSNMKVEIQYEGEYRSRIQDIKGIGYEIIG